MTTADITEGAGASELSAAAQAAAGPAWLVIPAFLALLTMYFLGVDQGMVSVFGSDLHIHEFLHDGRHALGFPCH